MEDINSRPVDEEDKRKLLEMLKRLNESEDTDTGGLNCQFEIQMKLYSPEGGGGGCL